MQNWEVDMPLPDFLARMRAMLSGNYRPSQFTSGDERKWAALAAKREAKRLQESQIRTSVSAAAQRGWGG